MIDRRLIPVILVVIAVLVGCSGTEEPVEQAGEQKAVAVRTALVERADFPVILRLSGSLRGDRQTMIPARVQTTVHEIPVKVGESVVKNQPLIMLDAGGVQSYFRQAAAVFRNAEKQAQRMRNLYKAGAISETQLDEAETAYQIARADYEAARQTIQIDAPFDGIVTDIYVKVGDETVPGTPLVEVADVRALRLFADASPVQVSQLQRGLPVKAVSSVDSSIVMIGKVLSVADAADQATRSFEVECFFASPLEGFAPGMYVTASIQANTLDSTLVVPSEALMYRTGKALLYVVGNDSTANLFTVTELASSEGKTAIAAEIQPGQRVVVTGQKNLTPGARVREAGL